MARRGDAIKKRGPSWFLDFEHNGIHHRRKLGKYISRTLAVKLAHKYRAEILSGNVGYGLQVKDLTFDEARKKFEEWAVANKKRGTAGAYRECLRRLSETFSSKRLSQVSSFLVEGHKQRRIQAGARVRANRELAVLKSLFNRCREWKLIECENPSSP